MKAHLILIIVVFFIFIVVGADEAAADKLPECKAKSESLFGDYIIWKGDVDFPCQCTYGRTKIYADRITYNLKTKVGVAVGNALLIKDETFVSADTITYNFETEGGPGSIMCCNHPDLEDRDKNLGYIIYHPECDKGFPELCPLRKLGG